MQLRIDEPDKAIGHADGNSTGDVSVQDGYASPTVVTGLLTDDVIQSAWIGTINPRAEHAGSGDCRASTIDAMGFDRRNHIAVAGCVVLVPHGYFAE